MPYPELKHWKALLIVTSILCVIPLILSLFLWNQLPDPLPTHWSSTWVPDSWNAKAPYLFRVSAAMLLFNVLFNLGANQYYKKGDFSKVLAYIFCFIIPVVSVMLVGSTLYFSLKIT
ncbi:MULTISPECIES: DUF1648 domain-containing protein [Caproicibacterium]|jgi:uncharacterized membrane protein|uniref:DUF1648 domain-containing protein n=1 Tax=Caproicibacterium lactatifermentans TaxID=2666138 RepID=A0A859DSI0_9FIRM|nr:DUF1648 domain-containing protein [Caproicibacterium lactatifermentans]ARP49862.1 hypothetical protein B6259_02500 [Ruminococcaceae bacterium CPB6]QKN24415.1 DUF1648 domain-containing protein [Caproicibacterium lactatifermentans]QKO30572.1 DUF1648 domain-containing protein [Caproicibacterium lactatifermentans]